MAVARRPFCSPAYPMLQWSASLHRLDALNETRAPVEGLPNFPAGLKLTNPLTL
jgi:hypothetical protein